MFTDRAQAGRLLGSLLRRLQGHDAVVVGIPRGGIPVSLALSEDLRLPLDFVTPRKLPLPMDPEAGFGAVTPQGDVVVNEELVLRAGLVPEDVRRITATVREEAERRERTYRRGRLAPPLRGRLAIVADDGLASGYTMLAAVGAVLERGARGIVVAVPCGSSAAVRLVSRRVPDVFCIAKSDDPVFAVASYYDDFSDLTDEDVLACLDRANSLP